MRILIIDNHSTHNIELAALMEDHEVHFADYANADYNAENYNLIILSGSHEQPFYSEGYTKELDLIKNTNIPLIGICLGCQLIAHAYGCSLEREEAKLKGLQEIKYIPNQSHYTVYEGHSFCVNEVCDDIIGVAASEFAYEIIKHAHKPQYGLQFHPEVTEPKNDGALLFTTILSEIIS